jgi:hypothetical protein
MTTTENTVVEDYGKVLAGWAKAEGPVRRPPVGEYNLELHDVTVEKGEFRYNPDPDNEKAKMKAVKAIVVLFRWHLDTDPSTGQSLTFPGRWYSIPLLDEDEIALLPQGQQTRIEITLQQLKNNLVKLLGYEPDDPFDAAKGFGDHVREAVEAEEPVRARVRIKNRKKEPDVFDVDAVVRLIN